MLEWFKGIFRNDEKSYKLFNGLLFFLLFLFSVNFYLERTIAFDSSYYAFKIIQYNQLNVENERFVAAWPQIIPLLALKLGASLKTFLVLYSCSYTIFNFLCFLIIAVFLKQQKVAVTFALSLCFAYRYNYFYIASEIHQVFMYLFVFAAVVKSIVQEENRNKIIFFSAISIVLLYLILNVHILAIIPIVYIVLYYASEKIDKKNILIGAILTLCAVGFYKYVTADITEDSYQGKKMLSLDKVVDFWENYSDYGSYNYFLSVANSHYSFPIILAVLTLFLLLLKKQFLRAILYAGTFVSFLLIILISYKADSPIVYQNYYSIFGIFILIPFVEIISDFNIKAYIKFSIFSIIAIYSLVYINKCSILFRNRLNYYDRLMTYANQTDTKKLIICRENLPWGCLWVEWALPFETLLYSSVNDKANSITAVAIDNMNDLDSLLNTTNLFIGAPWGRTANYEAELRSDYYNLNQSNYLKVSSSDTLFVQKNGATIEGKITIEPRDEENTFNKKIVNYINFRMKNTGDILLPTKPQDYENFFINYKVTRLFNGEIIQQKWRRLETDILPKNFTQFSTELDPIEHSGDYTMDVYLVWKKDRVFAKLENIPIKVK